MDREYIRKQKKFLFEQSLRLYSMAESLNDLGFEEEAVALLKSHHDQVADFKSSLKKQRRLERQQQIQSTREEPQNIEEQVVHCYPEREQTSFVEEGSNGDDLFTSCVYEEGKQVDCNLPPIFDDVEEEERHFDLSLPPKCDEEPEWCINDQNPSMEVVTLSPCSYDNPMDDSYDDGVELQSGCDAMVEYGDVPYDYAIIFSPYYSLSINSLMEIKLKQQGDQFVHANFALKSKLLWHEYVDPFFCDESMAKKRSDYALKLGLICFPDYVDSYGSNVLFEGLGLYSHGASLCLMTCLKGKLLWKAYCCSFGSCSKRIRSCVLIFHGDGLNFFVLIIMSTNLFDDALEFKVLVFDPGAHLCEFISFQEPWIVYVIVPGSCHANLRTNSFEEGGEDLERAGPYFSFLKVNVPLSYGSRREVILLVIGRVSNGSLFHSDCEHMSIDGALNQGGRNGFIVHSSNTREPYYELGKLILMLLCVIYYGAKMLGDLIIIEASYSHQSLVPYDGVLILDLYNFLLLKSMIRKEAWSIRIAWLGWCNVP